MVKYRIEYWVDEDARDAGYGEVYASYNSMSEAVEVARKMYYSQSMAAVEVIRVNGKKEVSVWTINDDDVSKFPDGEWLIKRRKKK